MKLYHIILNNLRRRKSKMFFMLMGIVIGIATIVSVYNVIISMQNQMTKQVSEFGVNVSITPDSGGLTFSYGGIILPEILYDVEQLTTEDLETIAGTTQRDMIRIAAPKLISVTMLESGQKATVVGGYIKQEFLIKPWLTIKDEMQATDLESTNSTTENNQTVEQENQEAGENSEASEKKMDFIPIDLKRQDIDLVDLADTELIIGFALANSLKVNVGDTITLHENEYEIKYILTESGEAEDNQILMNLEASQKLFEKPDEITVIDLSVDYTAGSEEALIKEITEKLPHAQVSSLRQETLRRDEMLGRLVRFGVAISILIVFIGMLVVGITMSGSVRERTREIGIFRALGFRKSHIIKIILSEAVIISFLGGILGYFVGYIISSYAGPVFIGETMSSEFNSILLLASAGLSVVIGLVSGIMPALKASKLDPAEALRFI